MGLGVLQHRICVMCGCLVDACLVAFLLIAIDLCLCFIC